MRTGDFPTLQARRAKGDFEVALVGWFLMLDPDVSPMYRTGGIYNEGKYSNPKVDALLDKGAVTADLAARKKVYDEFQQAIYDDPRLVILYSPNVLGAVSKRMINVKMATMGILWNMEQWDVK